MAVHHKQDKHFTWCRQQTMMPIQVSDKIEECTCIHCIIRVFERSNNPEKVEKAREIVESMQYLVDSKTGGK